MPARHTLVESLLGVRTQQEAAATAASGVCPASTAPAGAAAPARARLPVELQQLRQAVLRRPRLSHQLQYRL